MISKVISGGQCGADIAGLRAAAKYGLATGGWIPRGYITLEGPRPEYADLYGIQQHTSPRYPPRTYANVHMSDGTIRFAANFGSPGELCTLKAIRHFRKPYFDVDLLDPGKDSIRRAIRWAESNNINTLNVAGNTERTHGGTEAKVEGYLGFLFDTMGLAAAMVED